VSNFRPVAIVLAWLCNNLASLYKPFRLFWVFQGQQEFLQLANLGPDQPLYGIRSGHLVMEWSFGAYPYSGPVTLLFGRESDIANPYLRFRYPELMWRRAYNDFRVEIIPGTHDHFFHETNISDLTATVSRCLTEALTRAPTLLPPSARRSKVEAIHVPSTLPQGSRAVLILRVHNLRARSTITTHFGTPIHPARLRCAKGYIQ